METLHKSERSLASLEERYYEPSEPAYPLYPQQREEFFIHLRNSQKYREQKIKQRRLIQKRRQKKERTFRNRWRRNIQSIAYNFPDYDFLSDAYSSFFNFIKDRSPEHLAKFYNSICIYSELNHIPRDISDCISSSKPRTCPATLKRLFNRFSLNNNSKNLSALLANLLLYSKEYDLSTLKESEDFSKRLNRYLSTYFLRIKSNTEEKRKSKRKIG